MKKFLAPLIAAAALVSFGTGARADSSWTYDWTSTQGMLSHNGGYSLNVLPFAGQASGTSDIIAANLTITQVNPAITTDSFNGNLVLTGTFGTGSNQHSVTFDIGVDTTISGPNQITSVYPVTVTPVGQTSWDGGAIFAKVDSVTLPGALNGIAGGATGVGSISVLANGSGLGTQPPSTPEPSTMLLSCVGLAFGGIATWRKRKQAIAA